MKPERKTRFEDRLATVMHEATGDSLVTCANRVEHFRTGRIYAHKYAELIQKVVAEYGSQELLFA